MCALALLFVDGPSGIAGTFLGCDLGLLPSCVDLDSSLPWLDLPAQLPRSFPGSLPWIRRDGDCLPCLPQAPEPQPTAVQEQECDGSFQCLSSYLAIIKGLPSPYSLLPSPMVLDGI